MFIPSEEVSVLESPEEVLTTLTREGRRRWMYPTPSAGRFERRRRVAGWLLILLFMALPVVRIGGEPGILLDFIHREFAILGLVFRPTDTLLLLLFMVGALLSVFLVTALLGRVWCGWACPQTVYLEFVYRPIERWIEGAEHVRRRRDAGPWTWDKAWRKGVKLALYLAISLVLAHTFVAYFVGWERLMDWMQRPPFEHGGFFVMMALTTGLVFFDFGYFREQMCTIACPYARLQSVLLDPDSLIVSYDPNRGEPRGKRGRKQMALEAAGQAPVPGDCIDCGACVRTCPTGIDIRDGLQMECIACTQCIDACDDIMLKIDRPPGLIRYTSEQELAGRPTRRWRPRTLLYTALLAAVGTAFVAVLASRGDYDVNVARSVGAPFTELPDGRIANRLRFRVQNQTPREARFTVETVRPAGVEVKIVGVSPVTVEPREVRLVEAWIVAPRALLDDGREEALFRLRFADGYVEDVAFPLLGPNR